MCRTRLRLSKPFQEKRQPNCQFGSSGSVSEFGLGVHAPQLNKVFSKRVYRYEINCHQSPFWITVCVASDPKSNINNHGVGASIRAPWHCRVLQPVLCWLSNLSQRFTLMTGNCTIVDRSVCSKHLKMGAGVGQILTPARQCNLYLVYIVNLFCKPSSGMYESFFTFLLNLKTLW